MTLGLLLGPVLGGVAVLGTFVAFVTVPLRVGIFAVARLPRKIAVVAAVERARIRVVLGADLPRLPAPDRGPGGWSGVQRTVRDRRTWRELGWLAGQILLGPLTFVLVTALWAGPVFLITLLTWTWAVDRLPLWLFTITTRIDAFAAAGVGLLLLPFAALAIRGVGRLVAVRATRWLGPDLRSRLEAQVADLERTRAIAISAADSERRRVERDLHDGAQSRLVSLAVTLALAEEALDRDVEASRRLLQEARAAAVAANEELRALARGLAPTVLRTRGLRAALDGLAATAPMPVEVRTDRYTVAADEQLESAFYFVAAEALVNAAKHGGATHVEVELRTDSLGWQLEVTDDGNGGAQVVDGGGLAGLRDRLAPLDAVLRVHSGPGGTVVQVRA